TFGGTGQRRLHSLQRHARRPRVHGLVGGPKTAAQPRRLASRAGHRDPDRRSRHRPARAAGTGRRHRFGHYRFAPARRRPGHRPLPRSGNRIDSRACAIGRSIGRRSPAFCRRAGKHYWRRTMSQPRVVSAPRGARISARSWQTEAPMRMLMNNLDPQVAERPDDLVVYGGTGKAARSWQAYDAIVRTLTGLADDETLLVASGKPVGVFRTHVWAPRVLIANANLV